MSNAVREDQDWATIHFTWSDHSGVQENCGTLQDEEPKDD
jgi:hypothetical protein